MAGVKTANGASPNGEAETQLFSHSEILKPQSKTVPEPRANSWFRFQASATGVELWLYDEIGAYGITAKDFIADLQRLGENEPFTLRLHSPGGDVMAGAAIANAIRRHKGAVTTQIDGLCASIATIVALAGNPVCMAENGIFMIHRAWSAAVGDSDELQNMSETLAKLEKSMIATYSAKTGLAPEKIMELLDQESWLSASDALELGFIDVITQPLKAAASITDFDLRKFRNAPQNLTQENHMKTASPTQTEIEAKADELYKAKIDRDQEIDATVAMVLKRDKKDFSALAAKFKKEDRSAEAFCAALTKSDEYKPTNVVGSGREHFPGDRRDIGSLVVNDARFQNILKQNGGTFPQGTRVQIHLADRASFSPRAALTTTSLDFGIDQRPGVSLLPQQRLYVADMLTVLQTSSKSVRYLQEQSFTNAATAVAEAGAKPPATLDIAKVDAEVEKIAVYTKVGEETLADFTQLGSMINERLPFMVSLTEEAEILNGNGAPPHLLGIMQSEGFQTQAKGADTPLVAIFKAITKIRLTHIEPDGIVIHPTDWQTLRLEMDANSQFYAGGPFTGAYGTVQTPNAGGIPPTQYATLWGLPCAITVSQTQGTALVGAFRQGATLYRRTGMTIEMSNSDQDDFIHNLVTIRAEIRCALGVIFPFAFCAVTGL